ncbi:MAG: hypothetical protein IJH25_02335 [Clostridia bacterium]|nr:hypothetical protein [Clostridia bacterium]MBQ6121525.1 hypothetical protein [Clostridia bacterium]
MMMSEFTERTGFEPTAEEYAEIEEQYYKFDGDKDAFCRHWKKNVGVEGICEARAAKIAQLRSTALETEKHLMAEIAQRDQQIARLEAELEREQEWKPYEDEHNVRQAAYEKLDADPTRKELTDDEAADLIAKEFGFARSKIRIVREVAKQEVDRHGRVRTVGTYERKPLFDAWDWNYIRFNVIGNVAMGYEMYKGELQMFWG